MAGSELRSPELRIAFIGVDPRDRGGIGQFGANLADAARLDAEVLIVSYRRLYPRWSRAGRQPIGGSPSATDARTERILVPWEPWTWLRAARTLRRFGASLVVIQWWSPIFGPCLRFLARACHRAGIRVVFVCHNDRPHERFPFGRALTRATLATADGLITLSSEVGERVKKLAPDVPVQVLHHPPNLRRASPAGAEQSWRHRVGPTEGPIILFFGNVRRYKGLDDLLVALPLVREKIPATLVVAGMFFEPLQRLEKYARRVGAEPGPHVRFFPGYVPSEEVPALFSLATVVALPYRSASQSGVLAQAALAQRPVVATAVGGLPEAINGHGLVVPPEDPAALAEGIVSALTSPPLPPRLPEAGWADWRVMIEKEARLPPEAASPLEEEPAGSARWGPAVAILALVASVASAVVVHANGRAALFGDAATHLLTARRVFDSATPGFAQLGNYFPPLQHVLEIPLVWIDPLYRNMWAGSLPAMGLFVGAVLGAYRLGVEMVRDRRAGALAAFAVGSNPNMLYLQASPMLESGIAMCLLWVAASLVRFRRTGRFADVVAAGAWSSVAVWATWAALILPFYGSVLIACSCRRHGFQRRKTETITLAYGFLAGFALVLWLGWNFFIQGDALYMLHYSQPVAQIVTDRAFVSGRPRNLTFAVLNYGAALIDVLGPAVTLLMVGVGLTALLRRRFFHPAGVTLLAGALVMAYLFFRGTAVGSPLWADVNRLTSDEARNLNIRYALWITPFTAVAVAAIAGRSRWRQAATLVAVAAGLAWFLPEIHGVSTWDPPAQSQRLARFEVGVGSQLARLLAGDQGRLLMSSVNGGDRIAWRSGVDPARFITESNGGRFQRALHRPTAYVRYVFLAPGSTVAARLSLQALATAGFQTIWNYDLYGDTRFRYALLKLRRP